MPPCRFLTTLTPPPLSSCCSVDVRYKKYCATRKHISRHLFLGMRTFAPTLVALNQKIKDVYEHKLVSFNTNHTYVVGWREAWVRGRGRTMGLLVVHIGRKSLNGFVG